MKSRIAVLVGIVVAATVTVVAPASAATITITSNADNVGNNGFCTLREAIAAANTDTASGAAAGECAAGSGTDTIAFAAAFDGDADPTNRITLGAGDPLPVVSQPVTITGGNCGNASSPKPCAQIDANGSGTDLTGVSGLEIGSPAVTVRGLAITDADNLDSVAVEIQSDASGVIVRNMWLGLRLDGTAEKNTTGVLVLGDNATIGGTTSADRNLFAAHELTALNIFGAANTTVQGNYFGTLADGATTAGIGNFRNIQVLGSDFFGVPTGTLIGGPESGVVGTCEAPCNVIANSDSGINLGTLGGAVLSAGQTRIEGNFLGLSAAGAVLTGNANITVGDADDVTIGGDPSRRNYLQEISARQGATNLDIASNFVGLNPAGTARVYDGLIELGQADEPVDGASVVDNRLGRMAGSIAVIQMTATESVVQGNVIGIGTGGQNVGGSHGIVLPGTGSGNLIGGEGPGEGNVIGNGETGIVVADNNTTVVGNRIGTNAAETQSHPMAKAGLVLAGDNNVIGGTTAASENVFANLGPVDGSNDAIHLAGDGSDFNTILRNRGSAVGGEEFIDLRGSFGPGNGATGPNNAIARPTITAGATSQQVSGTGAQPSAVVRVYTTTSTAGASGPRGVTAYAGQATADNSGNWTLNCPSAGCEVGLPGAGQVTANQTSTSGDSSEMADPKPYSDLPPDTTIASGPANAGVTGDSTPTFGFASSEPGSSFECSVDGGALVPCTDPHTTQVLSEGVHTFAVQATDSTAQVDATPASRSFTVDLTAPDTQIDSGPVAGETITDQAVSFGFSASEAGATFECRIDLGPFGTCSGPASTHSVAGLSEGAHTFAVRATDAAGNVDASPAVREFVVDTPDPSSPPPPSPPVGAGDSDPPETAIDKAPKRKSAKRKAKFSFSSDESGASFECKLDRGGFEACGAKAKFKVKPGKHTLEVRATDVAGNVDPTPAKAKWKVRR